MTEQVRQLIDQLRYRPVGATAAQMREAADLLERTLPPAVSEEQLREIAGLLKAAGWRDTCDGQWDGLRAVIPGLAFALSAGVKP